jgi:hypothetical protein
MTERISDGLLAELRRKMDDGTPRGMVWPILANLLSAVAEFAATPEEVELTNETLVALIQSGDDHAMDQIEMRACLAQLQEYLDRKKAS